MKVFFKVLNMATEESDNLYLRDRGYFYWRLLSSDHEARTVVLSEKPEIGEDNGDLDPALLDDLIAQISSLASIYHKQPCLLYRDVYYEVDDGGDNWRQRGRRGR